MFQPSTCVRRGNTTVNRSASALLVPSPATATRDTNWTTTRRPAQVSLTHTHTHKHAQNTQTRVETVVTADSCWLCVTNCAWIHAEMDSDLRAAQSWFLLLHEAECGSALCSSCCRLNLLNNTSFIFLNVPFKTLNWTQSGCARLFYKNLF